MRTIMLAILLLTGSAAHSSLITYEWDSYLDNGDAVPQYPFNDRTVTSRVTFNWHTSKMLSFEVDTGDTTLKWHGSEDLIIEDFELHGFMNAEHNVTLPGMPDGHVEIFPSWELVTGTGERPSESWLILNLIKYNQENFPTMLYTAADGTQHNYILYPSNYRKIYVPEPSTLALLGLGLAGVGLRRRRQSA